ncbi:MAG TPA: sensor histidine kinase [Steroidobacteraceae bacterium]
MSLRLQINLIIAALMSLFIGSMVYEEIKDTGSSVREEIEGSNQVATQFLTRVSFVYQMSGLQGMMSFLDQLGRIRANDVYLYSPTGELVYTSPPSTYKSGRDAPHWFARLVSPPPTQQEISIGDGHLVLRANSSRAVLDGWDDLSRLLWYGLGALILINVVVFWVAGRVLKPLQIVVRGLQRMEQGDYDARLPLLSGKEGRLMSQAFNRTAQAVADSAAAQKLASEARQRLQENRELNQMIQSHIEEERRSIARELHDELGQSITAVKSIGLSIAQRTEGVDAGINEAARLIVDTAGRMYDAVHEMIPRLRPFALDSFGLRDALADMAGAWRARHPELELRLSVADPLPPLSDTVTTCAYRIVQEALTNALRHASARRIVIWVGPEGQELLVRVEDDGIGLSPGWDESGHHGVRGMRERALVLGGSFAVGAAPQGGTHVTVRLPLSEHP